MIGHQLKNFSQKLHVPLKFFSKILQRKLVKPYKIFPSYYKILFYSEVLSEKKNSHPLCSTPVFSNLSVRG